MNKYNMIYEELCERVECGELTLEEAEMINDVAYDKYVTEKKRLTSTDRHIYKFKQRHNFEPDPENRNAGTITVDGQKYPVDLDVNNKYIQPANGDIENRQTGYDLSASNTRGKIFMNKDAFRMKPRRTDALLQHEIGHARLHDKSSNAPQRIKNAEFMGSSNALMNSQASELKKVYPTLSKHDIKKGVNMQVDTMFPDYRKKAKEVPESEKRSRGEMYSHMTKYTPKNNPHSNPLEFEADRYAINHTNNGKSVMKRALRNTYKLDRKNTSKLFNRLAGDEEIKNLGINLNDQKRQINKIQQEDYLTRTKAMNDKKIANYPLYKQ